MDVSMPISCVVPSLDGPVLAVLAGTTGPVGLTEIHRRTGRGSKSGILHVLRRMEESGLIHEVLGGFVLPSLEVAGPGMHWVEVSRAVRAADCEPSDETKRMLEAYSEYYEAAKTVMRAGATCHDVHTAVAKGFHDRGYHLGHVTGHSIGMTMIEFPKVGEGSDFELKENMVLSMHPHAIAAGGEECLYMQDTWLVTSSGGVPLADLAMEVWVQEY